MRFIKLYLIVVAAFFFLTASILADKFDPLFRSDGRITVTVDTKLRETPDRLLLLEDHRVAHGLYAEVHKALQKVPIPNTIKIEVVITGIRLPEVRSRALIGPVTGADYLKGQVAIAENGETRSEFSFYRTTIKGSDAGKRVERLCEAIAQDIKKQVKKTLKL